MNKNMEIEAIEIEIWKEGAENGSIFSMIALGFSYANGDRNLPQDDKIALEWFKKAADKGHPASRAIVEIYYESGILDFKNKEQKILEWASKGKEEEVLAMLLLGNIYETGLKNMEKDQVKALEWYKKAAKKVLFITYYASQIIQKNDYFTLAF